MYWECKRRLAALRQFRVLAFDYFQNVRYLSRQDALRGQVLMNDKSQKARHEINQLLNDVALSLDLMDVTRIVTWTPPPMIGGYIQQVDLIGNIFGLSAFDIPSQTVFDSLDRAIGAYENECRKLRRKSFNPFYWMGIVIVWFLRLPFKLLGAAGFNAAKAEKSLSGKLVKVVMGLAAFTAAILKIADDWSMIRRFLYGSIAALHRL